MPKYIKIKKHTCSEQLRHKFSCQESEDSDNSNCSQSKIQAHIVHIRSKLVEWETEKD